MDEYRIRVVENGFILEKAPREAGYITNPEDIHVFNKPTDLADWIKSNLITIEATRLEATDEP